jgi:hypothetical protein
MTVKQLIKELTKLPENTNVQIFCSYDNYSGEYLDFEKDYIAMAKDGNLIFDATDAL